MFQVVIRGKKWLPKLSQFMKVAIVYDRVNKIGGAERILATLFKLYPDAPLYTLVHDQQRAPWSKNRRIITSFMQRIPYAKVYHEFFPILPIFAFEGFDFKEFDVVISITAAEAKGIITHPKTLHISYVLTPTRYLWSHFDLYFSNKLFRLISAPLITLLRIWDEIAAQRPDEMITISKTVAARIKKYYKRDTTVIYPPVNLHMFESDFVEGDYFLIVARLVPYKKIDIAIEACNKLGLPLKIIGEGLDKKRLMKMAGPTVTFLGNLTDYELKSYYQKCRAFLAPQEEDFGITIIEALAAGKPVVAFGGGAALELIQAGVTGEFFYPQTTEALIKVLDVTCKKKYSWVLCRKEASKYGESEFLKNFALKVNQLWKEYKVNNI